MPISARRWCRAFDYKAMTQFYQTRCPGRRAARCRTGSPAAPSRASRRSRRTSRRPRRRWRSRACPAPPEMLGAREFPEFSFAATVLQASAAQIGVTVEIEQRPSSRRSRAIKDNHSNCFVLGNANLSPTDATKFYAAHYLTGGFYNTENTSDPTLEALVKQNPDGGGRAAALRPAEAGVRDRRGLALHHLGGAPEHGGAGAGSRRRLPHRPGRIHQRAVLGALLGE